MPDEWQPETRAVLPELEDDYEAHEFGQRTHFVPLVDKLDDATTAILMQLARGGIGDPE